MEPEVRKAKQTYWAVKERGVVMVNGYGFPALYATKAKAVSDGFNKRDLVRVKIVEI
jgi:hypothetical protein